MPLDLTTRVGKGSPLTAIEGDQNLTDIETLVNSLETLVSNENVDNLSTRLDAAEVDIDDLESGQASNDSELADHETRTTLNDAHRNQTSGNPHSVDAANVGLGNVTNDKQVKASQWLQNGFVDLTDSNLSWNDATRTLTLEPTIDDYDYYFAGVMYTRDGALTEVIANEAGLWIFYFDTSSSIIGVKNPSDAQIEAAVLDYTIIAYVYWDGTDGRLMDERHGSLMSPATHHWIHDNIGSQFKDGMALGDFTIDDDGDQSLDAQFSIGSGKFYDEDIEHLLDAVAIGAGLEIWYLDGAVWKWTTQGTAPNAFAIRAFVGGSSRAAYNNAGVQAEVGNGDYVLCHIFATNLTVDTADFKGRYIAIQGQATYATKALARIGAETELNTLVFGTLPLEEIVPVGAVIFQTSSAPDYANAVKSTTISTLTGDNYIDWRYSNLKAGGGVADHGALAGLSDDDHPQYIKGSEFTATQKVLVGSGVGTFAEKDIGIANDNIVEVDDADAADDDYAKFTANGLEGRSYVEVRSDINVENGATADQTGAEIKSAYEAEANAYTDTKNTKLTGIETGADVTDAINVASSTHGVAGKATPVDADEVGLIDSAASWVLKVLTWANIKVTLKTYFDTLYLGITDHGGLAGLSDDDHTQYLLTDGNRAVTGNFDIDGRKITFSNFEPEYRWAWGGGTPTNWLKIADISCPTGLYKAASFIVNIIDSESNYGHSADIIDLVYYVSCFRSEAVQDDQDTAYVSGPAANYVRVVKTSIGVYELQVKQINYYKKMLVTCRVVSSSSTVTYATNPTDGSTTGTIYNPTKIHANYLTSLGLFYGVEIDEFSSDGALAGNSDNAVPTEKAVKTYVDAKKLDDLATPDDNTNLNATTSLHGLLPKLGGGTTNFLRADGSWVAPSSGLSSYDTGWINRSDWTNVHLGSNTTKNVSSDVTHNLGTALSGLYVKLLISSTGADNGCFDVGLGGDRSNLNYGSSVFQISTNAIRIQIGASGLTRILDTGAWQIINTQDWYYKIKVFKMA